MSIFWNLFPSIRRHKEIMATLTDILAAVTESNTKTDSLITLVGGLREQIAAVPALSAEQQAQIDAIFTAVTEQAAEVQGALDANVPPDRLAPLEPITPIV